MFGRGFVGTIETAGRATLVREDDEFMMAGVEPGGMAASGRDRDAAFEAFRKTYTEILFDIAADSETFQDFKMAVEQFVHQTSPPALDEWNEAVAGLKWLSIVDTSVPRESANNTGSVAVTHAELSPTLNVISKPEHLIAAH